MEDFEKIYVDGVFVVAVNLVRSTMNEANEFRKILEDEISSGHTNLVIDLGKCDYVDSSFFGAIIMALRMMNDIDKKLKVVIPVNPREEIFVTTKTLRLFDLYESREEAIKSFEGDIQPES